MGLAYKEANFPADYRTVEVRQIMDAVYKLRSITVSGLAGMGKSNVVRFIVSHPQVRARYLKERANDYAFVHIDCAGLPNSNEAEILEEIITQLHYDGLSAGEVRSFRISHHIRRVLKEEIVSIDPALNLVLVLDYFDEAADKLDKSFFNYLFHLRNSRPQGNLIYIFAARRPLDHLHEFQELLDDGCIIGPLNRKDALASIRRDEARLGCSFDDLRRNRLIAWTGGHPGFLKNAGELLGREDVDISLSDTEVARQLLESGKIKNLCQELWDDLTPAEHNILSHAARGIPLPKSADRARVTYLKESGLLKREEDGQGVSIFCPLFKTFVQEKTAGCSAIRISAVYPNQAHIETSGGEEWVTLSPKLFTLLLTLTEAQGQILHADEIVSRVYGREAVGVTNAALSQLVKRLRAMLDSRIQRMANDPTYTCVETVRDVGYRLNLGV